MKRLARALIHLYPANWRERYGDECEALLDDNPPTLSGLFDLLKGAVRMQLRIPAFPKLALALSITGLLAGLGISFLVTPRYISTAELEFTPSRLATAADSVPSLPRSLRQLENEILSRTSLSNVIQNPQLDLYRAERTHIPLEDVIEKMRSDIHIQNDPAAGVDRQSLAFQIQFVYNEPLKTQRTVQTLITRFIDANFIMARASQDAANTVAYDEVDRLKQRIAVIEKRLGISAPQPTEAPLPSTRRTGLNLEVLDPPSPAKAIFPNRVTFMATGFGAGFVFALIAAIFRRRLPPIPFPAQTV